MSYITFEAAQRRAALDAERKNPKVSDIALRDYFAAKALQGICARVQWSYSGAAKDAYAYADALLEERNK